MFGGEAVVAEAPPAASKILECTRELLAGSDVHAGDFEVEAAVALRFSAAPHGHFHQRSFAGADVFFALAFAVVDFEAGDVDFYLRACGAAHDFEAVA